MTLSQSQNIADICMNVCHPLPDVGQRLVFCHFMFGASKFTIVCIFHHLGITASFTVSSTMVIDHHLCLFAVMESPIIIHQISVFEIVMCIYIHIHTYIYTNIIYTIRIFVEIF